MDRLEKQIAFLMEIDRLKHIYRQTYLLDKSRHDSDVEHSWHFAVMAMVLSEYAKDADRRVQGHEDGADTRHRGDRRRRRVCLRRQGRRRAIMLSSSTAAKRIFGMLPADQAKEYIALWEEFERRETPEAKFAAAHRPAGPDPAQLLHRRHGLARARRDRGQGPRPSTAVSASHRRSYGKKCAH